MSDQTRKFIIQLGDGGDPETFAFTCGARDFTLTFTNNLGEEIVLDCTDPLNEPATILRHLESQDTKATIAGTIATSALPVWRAWADDGVEKNVKGLIDEPAASNGGHWVFPAFLEEFEISQSGKATTTFSASIMGSGARTWADAA